MDDQSPETLDEALLADVEDMEQIALRLSCASRRQLARELNAYHLTVPQYLTLIAVNRHGESCTMSELAEAAHQVSATMTGIIDRLVERELVERRRDPSDRRALRVSLTLQGTQLLTTIAQQKRAQLLHILETFSPHDRREMVRLMQRYLEATLTEVDTTG